MTRTVLAATLTALVLSATNAHALGYVKMGTVEGNGFVAQPEPTATRQQNRRVQMSLKK